MQDEIAGYRKRIAHLEQTSGNIPLRLSEGQTQSEQSAGLRLR